jgi:hypothetical protein
MYQINSTDLSGSIETRINRARAAIVGALVVALTICLAMPARADTLWYNGDFASMSFGVLNGINMTFDGLFPTAGNATVYDDFNVPAGTGGWHIETVWSNNLMNFTSVTQATWSIRTNLSSGDAGTLIASGTSAATQTPTGRSLFELTEFTIRVSGLAIDLLPGTYWLAITPHGFGGAQASLDSKTDGLNAIGSPPGNNGNAFLNSPLLNADFEALDDLFTRADFSMGVAGEVVAAQLVPEPTSFTLTLLGFASLFVWASAIKRKRGTLRRPGER